MSPPRLIAALVTATATVAALVVQSLPAAEPAVAATARSAQPVVAVSGRLLDEKGDAIAAGRLTLAALRPSGSGWTSSEVAATATTDDSGRFSLVADSAGLPTNASGGVDLELSYRARPSEPGLVYPVEAVPATGGGTPWELQLPGSALLTPSRRSPTGYDLTFQLGVGLVSAPGQHAHGRSLAATTGAATVSAPRAGRGGPEKTRVVDRRPPLPPGLTRARAELSAATTCPEGYSSTGWAPLQAFKWGYVPAKLMITKDKGKLGFVINRTHETKLQVTMVVGGNKYPGGLTGAMRNSSKLEWKPKVGNESRKLWKVRWRYQKLQKWCMPPSGTFVVYLDVYKWRARNATGGNKLFNTGRRVTCGGTGAGYNDVYDSRTSLSRDTAVTFSGFFSIAGVKLDARQRNTSRQKFWIEPTGPKAVKACGSDNAPIRASLAREVRY